MHKVEVGDEVQWQGRMTKVKKLLGITVALDGVEDVICLPVDATRAEVSSTEHVFKDTNRHLVEVPDSYAIARWPRDADVATIARCILGTLKYEPHAADTTPLRSALEAMIVKTREPDQMSDCLVERIRDAVEDFAEAEVLSALSIVLVERALNHRRDYGTLGSRSEVKALVTRLTHGMIDICTEPIAARQVLSAVAGPITTLRHKREI